MGAPPLLYIATAVFIYRAAAEQVVLLDTSNEPSLDWTRYPFGSHTPTPGWLEESFTKFEQGINWRSYVVCDVAHNNVNNWLWTPFVERGNANRIYIEIKFTIRDCSLFPGNALSCKETFSLLYYEFDVATKDQPPWEPDSYKLVGRIAASEGRFNTNTEVAINTEVKSVPVTKKGVFFAFRDQGACISLLAIKIYYIMCPEVTINFAHFNATPTGREVTLIEQATGRCVDNAEVVDGTPTYLCKGDGKWYLPTGGCKCKPGFEPDNAKQACNVCSPGKFKHATGDDRCQPCPANSKAPDYGFAECKCNSGYYRASKDPKSMPCTQPPSAPQNLTINFVDQSTVILSWSPPSFQGGRTDTVYSVACDACGPSVTYMPHAASFNDTKVTISGLSPVTTYQFQVMAQNGVSSLSGDKHESVDIGVTTEASVTSATVNSVRVMAVKTNEIMLKWDPPFISDDDDEGADAVESYEVRCFTRQNDSNATIQVTKALEMTFQGLKQRTEYGFQVRAKTTHGWGEYSPVIYKTTSGQVISPGKSYIGDEDSMQFRVIAGVTVVVVVLVIIVIIMTVVFLRRGSDECNKKTAKRL